MTSQQTETTETQPVQPVQGWAITQDGRLHADSVSERRAVAIEWAENQTGGSWAAAKRSDNMRIVRVVVTVDETEAE